MSKFGVTLELDKPRTLRYGMNALVKIEEMLGKTVELTYKRIIGEKQERLSEIKLDEE